MTALFAPAPEPATELGRLRILSKTASIRVSPLQLGGMSIGDAWADEMGSMDEKTANELLDAYVAAGGNFIDTANNYQNEQSERIIGAWAAARGIRDQLVIATKYSLAYKGYDVGKGVPLANYAGNSKKSLRTSLRDSLKKLQTDYVDILYVHYWDWTTSIPEMMASLHHEVQAGRVLYLGISDTPAWIVAAANTYATANGLTPFSIYQGRWNIMLRDMEREIIPMCHHFGMAIAPWDAIGGGKFQSKKALEERKKNGEGLRSFFGAEQSENEIKISEALEKVAAEHGIESVTAVALAYVMSKAVNVFPIVGGRKVQHLHDNIQALKLKLTSKQIESLESVMNFQEEFPNNFIGLNPYVTGTLSPIAAGVSKLALVEDGKPISHE